MGHFEAPGRPDRSSRLALREGMSRAWRWFHHNPPPSSQLATPLAYAEPEEVSALLDAAPVGLLLLDANGFVLTANTAATRLLESPDGGLRGNHVDDVLFGCSREGEHYWVRPDGTHAPLNVKAHSLRLGGKDARLLVLTDTAIRQRQEKEAALQRDEIAHLSRVAMLGELSGALAHELNQPLATILTNAQAAQRLLRARGTATSIQVLNDILTDIVSEDRRAGEIIQRLRKWLRKEHNELVALVVNDVVLDALHLVRGDLLHRGVDVQLELAGNLPGINGDRILLQQVLLNFVINACDSMDGLPLPHMLRVRSCASEDGGVRVEVLDRGRGIDPEMLPLMFEPFETTKPGGMGMGLAVCRNIIDSHGGRVLAHALPEGGACVGFELPARRL
jgi:two-component system sensor kinase FixL